MQTSISGLDSRSRYHTAELKRSVLDDPSIDRSDPVFSERTGEHSALSAINHGNVRNPRSETVGDYARPTTERSVFRYGFYIMLVLLIGVLAFLVFQKPKTSQTQTQASLQPSHAERVY